jgi:16S rRNA (adenine1518-N6/adenine1519-N6)-dimethyltransferase
VRAGREGGGGKELPPPRKRLGQHFLSDPRILGRIVDALAPGKDETVVEIGPGRGAMTDLLRERASEVIAIEYDRKLAAMLRDRYANSNVRIIEADVLDTDLGALVKGPYALIGNVPYYITTPILFHALRPPRAARAVYLVQREVANRMRAAPGTKDYGALTVNLQSLATVDVLFRVPAGAFQPPPKVESAVVRVTPRRRPLLEQREEKAFREFVQAIFGMRRKQMRRVLREIAKRAVEDTEGLLHRAEISADARPETLAPGQFAALFRAVMGDGDG